MATLQILNPQLLFMKAHRPILVFPGECRPAEWGPEEVGKPGGGVPSCVAIMGHNLAGLPGQLALVTVGTMQGRPLSHSSGVRGTTFLTLLGPAGEGKDKELGSRGLEIADDCRNP